MTFTHRIRVRYGEVDAQGVVFNAHWLAYFDDTMVRYLEALGYDPKATFSAVAQWDAMVVKSTLEWHGPAGFDDEVAIEVTASRLGSSSFDLSFTATVKGRRVVTATTTYVVIDPKAGRSQPIPDDLRAALQR
jgi:acyl-CoA thioester hydrolase